MYKSTIILALAGLSVARPLLSARHPPMPHQASSNTTSHFSASASAVATAAAGEASSSPNGAQLKSGNPFSFPLANEFPNVPDTAKAQINVLAQGIIPNGGAPTLDAGSLTSFQLIAFNEIWEVAFFTSLLFNVTNDVPGYTLSEPSKTAMIKSLTAIQAQEESHADLANTLLKANNIAPIEACQYQFPTTTLADAIGLASAFTDVVLGTLSDIQLGLTNSAVAGAQVAGVVPIIGSVIGNEAEQNGFFRAVTGKVPSAKPFLTQGTGVFAASVLFQDFVVAGSCPAVDDIKINVLKRLSLTTAPVVAADQMLSFSVEEGLAAHGSTVNVVFINGQQVPVVVQAVSSVENGVASFSVAFPYSQFQMDGLTMAVLTSSADADGVAFASGGDVAKVAIAGPALIEIN